MVPGIAFATHQMTAMEAVNCTHDPGEREIEPARRRTRARVRRLSALPQATEMTRTLPGIPPARDAHRPPPVFKVGS